MKWTIVNVKNSTQLKHIYCWKMILSTNNTSIRLVEILQCDSSIGWSKMIDRLQEMTPNWMLVDVNVSLNKTFY
jgi:hypothetical protein